MRISKRGMLLGSVAVALSVALTSPAFATPVIGQPAPAFSVVDAEGRTRTLAEFAGRMVILEWTNSGCPYVGKHYNSSSMQTLQRDATQQGIIWLSVISSAPGQQGYLDGPGAIAHARQVNAHPSAILLDPSGAMGHLYNARNTPQMFIINRDGRVVYQGAIDDRPTARPESLQGAHNYVRAALADLAAGRPVATPETTPYGCSVKYAS